MLVFESSFRDHFTQIFVMGSTTNFFAGVWATYTATQKLLQFLDFTTTPSGACVWGVMQCQGSNLGITHAKPSPQPTKPFLQGPM